MFDTHVNLHAEAFAEDLGDVLARARAAGVSRMLAICDRFDNFPAVQAIAQAHDDIWCSVGTHPHHARDFPELSATDLIEAAGAREVVAIGETGLDFHYRYSPQDDQLRSLRVHIAAARETGLPVILHTREADADVAQILIEEYERGAFLPLLHCYTGSWELARTGLERGGYVSVSGILSFRNARDVREVIAKVPLDRVILETDCPYLAPVPHRGRRNEPAFLADVGAALARLHGRELEEILEITHDNALRLFARVSA